MRIGNGLVIGLAAAALACFTSCAPRAEIKQAKLYENGLATMIGGDIDPVSAKICYEWKFGMADFWKWESPSAETVLKNNHPLVGFSKQEVAEIFPAAGRYEVRVFAKPVAGSSATTGESTQIGLSVPKDEIHEAERQSYIRAVFRDRKLIHYRVWAALDLSVKRQGLGR